jgi:methionyl-tRNA formyltransferase
MRIVIITQDEPFFLADNLKYLIQNLPSHFEIVACIVNEASPFGKKESFVQKIVKTYQIFGFIFFSYYTLKFIASKLDKNKKIDTVLKKHSIEKVTLDTPINHPDSVAHIKGYQPDILISILGNQIFREPIIKLAPRGCLNLHTALLPKYRGLMPTFWVMKNNERYTGVSVFFVDEGIDSGPIIVQEKIEIGNRTQEELIAYTKQLGMQAIIKALHMIKEDDFVLLPNDDSKQTYYSFPTKKDVKVFLKNGKRFF